MCNLHDIQFPLDIIVLNRYDANPFSNQQHNSNIQLYCILSSIDFYDYGHLISVTYVDYGMSMPR